MATVGTVAPDHVVATPLNCSPDLIALSSQPGLRAPAVLSVRGWRLLVADPVARLESIDSLSRYADAVGWRDPAPGGPPFRTGAVGFLTEDSSAALLHLPRDERPAVAALPPVCFAIYEWAVAVSPEGRGWIVAAADRLPDLRAWASAALQPGVPVAAAPRHARFGLARREHAGAVRQILDWIAAGDLYQANLTFQVAVPWATGPFDLARLLEHQTPGAAHAALIILDESRAVVSVSPETFLRIDGDRITTRPIKGTRPRGRTRRDDEAAAAALRASAKDAAEHVMIVDLERNDLGRVCRPGSVVVPEYAALEQHPTVWHLTSTVQGRLRPDASFEDVVAATFPPGSVTGTPKRMAVARTRLLEPVRRGAYCGAIGLVTTGLVELSVAIRTAVVDGGVASYGTGGGIVADSEADAEYDEALAKAAAFLRATGATGAAGAD